MNKPKGDNVKGSFISSLNWELFQQSTLPPATEIAKWVLESSDGSTIGEKVKDFYGETLQEFLSQDNPVDQYANILCSSDWYPVKTFDELELLNDLNATVFSYEGLLGEELVDGFDAGYVDACILIVPADEKPPESIWTKIFKRSETKKHYQLQTLITQPYRCDLQHLEQTLGEEDLLIPDIYVHSPEEVSVMYEEALFLKHQAINHKIQNEYLDIFQTELLPALEKAASQNVGLYIH